MKKIIYSLALVVVFFSCNQKTGIADYEPNSTPEITENKESKKHETTLPKVESIGSWVGQFVAKKYKEETDYTYANLISLFIDEINGNEVIGHSVVAGNLRPFVGTIEKQTSNFHLILKEPGDDKYDGTFECWIQADSSIIGTWKSYDENLKVTERKYTLAPKTFTYNPNNNLDDLGDFIDLGRYKDIVEKYDNEEYFDRSIATVTSKIYEFNPSIELIPESEIANMKKGDLQVLRNSIYAKHGYSFKNKIFRTIFDLSGLDWYMPVSIDVQNDLTEIEKQNIALMKRYEEYAEDYYDSFGR